MSDRSLIFNAKGTQIGYIEGDRAFDLTGRERCDYARATGNLSELNGGKIVDYISLDGTFVGLSWISEELFGKPSGEVHRTITINRRHQPRPKKANLQRPQCRRTIHGHQKSWVRRSRTAGSRKVASSNAGSAQS
jgi:hypothetical protein